MIFKYTTFTNMDLLKSLYECARGEGFQTNDGTYTTII